MTISVVAAPTAGLVSLDDAKAWLSVVGTAEDSLITGLVGAASDYLDGPGGVLNRLIREWEISYDFDCFPAGDGGFAVPLSPVRVVSSFTYTDLDGAEQDLVDTENSFSLRRENGLSIVEPGTEWPLTDLDERIKLTYKGFEGALADDGAITVVVPKVVDVACKMLISDMFDNRSTSVRSGMVDNPSFKRLLASQHFGLGL